MNTAECQTIGVTSCRKCPFVEYGSHYASCMAPVQIHDGKYNVYSYFKDYKSPKWCPLKKVSSLIIKHG